jgi:hypothetical protein
MIDGSHLPPKKKKAKKAGGNWVARSCPDAELNLEPIAEEMDFPGPASVASGKARNAFYLRPQDHEVIPAALDLATMAREGYYACHSPCFHIQMLHEGCECTKCGNPKMRTEPALPKVDK